MKAALQALSSLAYQDPTPAYFAAFHEEIKREKNDRGAAILLSCHVEVCLRYAIRRGMKVKAQKIKDTEKLLFKSGGPLHSFEGKLRVGFALGVFGDETKYNLDCIKGIRNAFAHAVTPITFETPQVSTVCKFMKMPEILPPCAIDPATLKPRGILGEFPGVREIFQKICEATSHNLFLVSVNERYGPLP